MAKPKLNDLHFSACAEYSLYLETGLKAFKDKAEALYEQYKSLGGKKALRYIR